MIDRATIDKIMDATNIVDVVGEFVTLRKAGVNYKGLCPFHDDTTPSFMVSPSKQICKCFACGEGGTAINFLMKHEQITYPEALRWLAKKYNIEVEEKELTEEERKEQSARESMFIVNEWAMKYFQNILKNDPDGIAIGKQYFRSRGIRDDIIEKFNLGYSLQKRDALALAAQKAGYQSEFLEKTGLCIKGEKGLHDRYAGRVIFPWFNVSGRVVAFGGRLLDARTKGVQQKYVNSPNSEIYVKENELYGLYQAKKAIAKEDRVYMVEGYTDVIAMHQCGLENVVANSGTALSQVLLLPDGDDPDSFSRKHSAQEFKAYIEQNATDFISFKTHLTVENVTDPVKRSEAIGGIVKSISLIPDQILRSTYLSELSQRLGIKEQTLINSMNNMIRKDLEDKQKEREREAAKQEPEKPQEFIGLHTVDEQTHEVERLLIRTVIRDGEKVIYENVETDDGEKINLTVAQYIAYDLGQDGLTFHDERYNRILQEAVEHSGEEGFKAETYFMQHPDVEISELAIKLAIDRHQLGKGFQLKERENGLRQNVIHLVLDLRLDIIEKRLKEIQAQLKEAGNDTEKVMALLTELKDTQQIRDAIAKQLGNDLVR